MSTREGWRRTVQRWGGGVALLCAATAWADTVQKPLWEAGLGAGAVGIADYRGADRYQVYPGPVPYLVYRGRFLRADEDGMRGLLFDKEFAELNISASGFPPVPRRATGARAGMPGLKPTVELGSTLDIHLWRTADRRVRLDLDLPARRAATVESSPHSLGWVSSPRLDLDVDDLAQHAGWSLGLSAGPDFASRAYHSYYYDVAPQFASAGRAAYRAHGGYAGSQLSATLSKRFPKYWVGAFASYDTLVGAAFASSPLVRSNSSWIAGVGIAWMLGQSSTMIETHEQSGGRSCARHCEAPSP